MSGFRKFRSTLHRRRRTLEAVELGFLATTDRTGEGAIAVRTAKAPGPARPEPDSPPLEFSPSVESREIGPAPIGWLKSRRPETDN